MSMTTEEFLEHYGKKGMKWGTTTSGGVSRLDRKVARKEVQTVTKTARQILKESRKASTIADRKKAANRYEKEVLNKLKTKEFKETYRKASTVGKGELAVTAVLTGGLGAMVVSAISKQQQKTGPEAEIFTARLILKELRS